MSLPLAFLSPWMLVALLALPLLWLLLRLIPPRPRLVQFPPTRLLLDVVAPRQTPSRTPWWLILLRLGLAAIVILALARPIWNPVAGAGGGSGPVVMAIDNGWGAAPDWSRRVAAIEQALAAAESAGRPVALVALAGPARGDLELGTADAARDKLRVLAPEPVVPERSAHLPAIGKLLRADPGSEVIWFADGLALGEARAFADALRTDLGSRQLTIEIDEGKSARGLAAAVNAASELSVRVLRAETGAAETLRVRALDLRSRPLGDTEARFAAGEAATAASFDMPVELRNDVARLEIVGESSAAAVQLLDGRWKRRSVGLVTGATADTALPLLAPNYYLSRAMSPFADIRRPVGAGAVAGINELLDQRVPVLVLSDVGTIAPDTRERLGAWIRDGGVLIRFAGSRLAATADELVPVRLRRGGRVLGGALAWETPQKLGSFAPASPFAGLAIPDDVLVNRQVLAEPDASLPERTWASLADGTPLVTAAAEGKGAVVLFHVTADTTWSNLPLSGSFVEMLRRVIGLAGAGSQAGEDARSATDARAAEAPATVAPSRTLDGFGAFRSPPATARPIPVSGAATPSLLTPPGFYGPPDGLLALNTLGERAQLERVSLDGLGATVRSYAVADPVALAPWLLVGATMLGILDCIVVFLLGGGAARLGGGFARRAAVIGLGLLLAAPALDGRAQDANAERMALEATLATRLAYVVTRDSAADATSKAGLEGLTSALASRTALEPAPPIGVDPAKDELAFFPLLYWPMVAGAPEPDAATLSRIDAYMKQGGTILFDSRDGLYGGGNSGPGAQAMRRILARLDVPELEPVPKDHVLTKAFYLLQDFPGRYTGSPLWVEAMPLAEEAEAGERPARPGDGVSPILITANDLAGAWAVGADGTPMYPTQPADPRQREIAYRVGINIVMYTLTGNYKADQVHVPALLERLGQ
jgi:hypothetical protein